MCAVHRDRDASPTRLLLSTRLRWAGVGLVLAGLFVQGCASVPKDYPRTQSAAFQSVINK